MESHIEPRVLLQAAETIQRCGARDGSSYCLDHIYLDISFDGYTMTLRHGKVSVSLLFHNKIQADYRKLSELEAFYKRVKMLVRNHESLV